MSKRANFENLMKGVFPEKPLFYPILMHFAARYNSKTYGEFASDYRILVESNLKCYRDFDIDILSVISDPYRETAAFGAEIQFISEGVPRCKTKVIQSPSDIINLKNPDIFNCERTMDRIKAVEYYQKILKNEVPIMGWVEGPLAEACNLAGVSEMLIMLMTEEEQAKQLLDKCFITAKHFAKAQVEAGCCLIGIGDAICSQIDAETYRRFLLDLHKDLVDYIHSIGSHVKLHICGDTTHLWPWLKLLDVDIFDPDYMTFLEDARQVLGTKVTLSGNINPAELQNLSVDETTEISKNIIQKNTGKRFILSAGCEITVNTPPPILRAMSDSR